MFTNKELGVFSDLLDTFVDDMDCEDLKQNLSISSDEYQELRDKLNEMYEKPILSLFEGKIELTKKGSQDFIIRYGKQMVEHECNYQDAYTSLGQAIFHHLSSEGLMDNKD